MSVTARPRTTPVPLVPEPAPPVRQYSFTDWQTNNPTSPPPGDRMDAEYDRANTAISQTLSWVEVSLNTDGTLKAGSVGQSQMVSGLFDDIAQGIIDEVQPLVDQAQSYASAAAGSSSTAQAAAAAADNANTAAGGSAATASNAAILASTANNSAQGYATTAQTAADDAENAANDTAGDVALAQDYADVTQAWAEHMPDTIPPNILAVMGITGDHWSSRWWANQAAIIGEYWADLAATTFGARQRLQALLYRATANQTVFRLTTPDLASNYYTIVSTEAVEVHVNGARLPQDDPNPGSGDWSLNPATSTVTFLTPLRAGSMVQIDVLSPDVSDQSSEFYLPASGAAPFAQATDINTSYHLSRWAKGGTQRVVIIGDSTSTDTPVPNYTVDATQTIWGALKAEIARQNPQCSFTFVNRGISGSNWAWVLQTGTQIGMPTAPTPPPWFTDLSLRWIDYVKVLEPETVFFLLGTNATSANTALYIGDVMTEVGSWGKRPDMVIITNKTANADAGGQYADDQEYYKATSAFLRTFARTNGRGFNPSFPFLRFGLLDPGRHYNARAFGKDFAYQYLTRVPSAIRNGLVLTGPLSTTVTTIGTTTDGDLRMTLVFVNGGGTAMFAACGTAGFYINISKQTGNRLHVSLTSGGIWTARYQITGTDAAPAVTGVNYSPPAGDVTMTITLKGEVVQVSLNTTLVMDTTLPRFICNATIAIASALAPVGAPMVFNVTEFYEGIGAPSFRTLDPASAFGQAGGPQAGNDINHPSSSTVALIDAQVIASTNWGVPQVTVEDDEMAQLYVASAVVGNGADITVDQLQRFTLNSSQLRNIGDAIIIDVGGQIAASTDTKSVWVRWVSQAGAALWTTTGSGGSLCHWSASITITKQSAGVQQYKAQGATTSANYLSGTITGQVGQDDTVPIDIFVYGQNATNPVANSVTCRIFRVAYLKAPGT